MDWWMLRRHIHPSWMIATLCVGVAAGLALSRNAQPGEFAALSWLISACIVLVPVFMRPYVYLVPIACFAGVLLGLWRGSIVWDAWSNLEPAYGTQVELRGIVKEDIDFDNADREVLRLHDVRVDGREQAGLIWVTLDSRSDIRRSDEVIVRGELSQGFGSFVAAMYRAELGAVYRPVPGDVALHVRDGFADTLRQVIPEPQASLGIGYILGQKRALPEDLAIALQVAGLTHIVVASGYNLTILVRLARRIFARISKFLALAVSGGMVVGFMAITGLSPSMSRAGLVAGLSLIAWYYGRRIHPVVLLVLAAAITGFIEPSFVWGDLGWLLSFTAFAGVMILAPLLQAYFYGDKKPGFIRQVAGETASAFIMTAPILVLAFSQLSNVAILANMLILPLVPLAMLLTFVAGMAATIWTGLGVLIGYPTTWLLTYMTATAEWLASLPWALREVAIEPWVVWCAYALLAVGMYYLWRKTKFDLGGSNIVE